MLAEEGKRAAGSEPETAGSLQRERLFRAALSVALDHGFGHVTLDAVARRAGVSKGGLLYHFASKTQLIQALLARYARPGKFCDGAGEQNCSFDPLAIAALIAAAEDPSLLKALAPQLCVHVTASDIQLKRRLAGSLANKLSL